MSKPIITVTAALLVKEGRIFAARRGPGKHLEGYWEFPGGKLEENESPENCLQRELHEEFSISSKVGSYIGESLFDYGEKIVRLLGYEVEHIGGQFELVDHDEIRWLSLEELHDVKWAPADIPLVEQYEFQARATAFYSTNTHEYCEETVEMDVGNLYQPFLAYLPLGAHILDLGCGSGRDSKAFRDLGYEVTAIDGNPDMASWASKFTGHEVIVKSFQTLDQIEEFDGVWASASLLHCPSSQLNDAIQNVLRSLKPSGVAYMSYKWGDSTSIDNRGRSFTNHTIQTLKRLVSGLNGAEVLQIWDSDMVLRGANQKWVYAILRKSE